MLKQATVTLALAASAVMTVTPRAWRSSVVFQPPGYCSEGAVNVVSPNYAAAWHAQPPDECELVIGVERVDPRASQDSYTQSGWLPVGELQGVTTVRGAHQLMFLIGQCGVVLYGAGGWESPGRFYQASELRVAAIRQPPCQP
jgi:hypothetical protein